MTPSNPERQAGQHGAEDSSQRVEEDVIHVARAAKRQDGLKELDQDRDRNDDDDGWLPAQWTQPEHDPKRHEQQDVETDDTDGDRRAEGRRQLLMDAGEGTQLQAPLEPPLVVSGTITVVTPETLYRMKRDTVRLRGRDDAQRLARAFGFDRQAGAR